MAGVGNIRGLFVRVQNTEWLSQKPELIGQDVAPSHEAGSHGQCRKNTLSLLYLLCVGMGCFSSRANFMPAL